MNIGPSVKTAVCIDLLEQCMAKIVDRTGVNNLPVGVQHMVAAYMEAVGLDGNDAPSEEDKRFVVMCRQQTLKLHESLVAYKLPCVVIALVTFMHNTKLPIKQGGAVETVVKLVHEQLSKPEFELLRTTRETDKCHEIIEQFVANLKETVNEGRAIA